MEALSSDRNWYGIGKMLQHVRQKWKPQPADLHDALLHASIAVPQDPSTLAYVSLLWEHCGSAVQMQHQQRRKSIKVLKEILKCFQRGGAYFGALSMKGAGQQAMLAERIARIMGELLQQAKRTEASDAVATEPDREEAMDSEDAARATKTHRLLHMQRREYGTIPQDASVLGNALSSILARVHCFSLGCWHIAVRIVWQVWPEVVFVFL